MPTKGITISVTAETNAGGRRHMEDYLAVKLCPNEELCKSPDLREQAFVGVFDGHGGKEAAKFARERLWDIIQTQPKYLSSDVEAIQESIQEAFVALHQEMEPLRSMSGFNIENLSLLALVCSICPSLITKCSLCRLLRDFSNLVPMPSPPFLRGAGGGAWKRAGFFCVATYVGVYIDQDGSVHQCTVPWTWFYRNVEEEQNGGSEYSWYNSFHSDIPTR